MGRGSMPCQYGSECIDLPDDKYKCVSKRLIFMPQILVMAAAAMMVVIHVFHCHGTVRCPIIVCVVRIRNILAFLARQIKLKENPCLSDHEVKSVCHTH